MSEATYPVHVMPGGLPNRAVCVSRDDKVRQTVRRALEGAGITVDYLDELPTSAADLALVVVDREVRRAAGAALRALGAPVIVVGDDLDDDGLITLMALGPVSHCVADPGDRDLGVTSEKLVSGDVFGLEKYLAAGTSPPMPISERVVGSDVERRAARGAVCAWAEAVGARRPIVHRLASVIDELMMNALRDAPCRATVRWACDDHVLAVSVGDELGALSQRDVIDNVRRARSERGRPQPASDIQRGAGLGLYLVLANVASLVVNVAPGRRTEVVCLFDRAAVGRPAIAPVRSLHVFAAP
jgi:hypothetical protein